MVNKQQHASYRPVLWARILPLLMLAGIGIALSACNSEPVAKTQRNVVTSLQAPAELIALEEASIGPPNINRMWQFKIEYLARENAMVKQGDMLVRFDGQQLRNDLIGRQSDLDAAIKQAEKQAIKDEADLQDLQLALAEAKMNEDKARRKVEITDASRSEIERKKQQAEYKIASESYRQAQQRVEQHQQAIVVNKQVQQAKIDNRQVRVDNLKQSIAKLSVSSPRDGMVTYASDWNDEKSAVGDTVYMGRTLLLVSSLSKIAAKVEFDESDSAKVTQGQSVKVTLDAYPERPFSGTIKDIGKAYRTKSQNNLKVVFDAWVSFDELDTQTMRPGMKATIELIEGEA